MFGKERQSIWVMLRCLADMPIGADDLIGFESDPGEGVRIQMAIRINQTLQTQKREKMDVLSEVFNQMERKPRTPDALRKWSTSRLDELVDLMNGNPPTCAYTADILFILIEKTELVENVE
jgi:hypothetical protein